jgi:hypothetical protein
MSNISFNNPASRLYNFLEQGLNFKPQEHSRNVVQQLLATTDQSQLLHGIADMRTLVDESVALYQFHYAKARLVLHWVDHTKAAFEHLHLQGNWSTFRDHIDPHTMDYLHHVVEMLDVKLPQSRMSVEDVKSYRAELNDLLEEVLKSDEPPELKTYLMNALSGIIHALDRYFITGDVGVLDAAERAVGTAVVNREILEEAKSPLARSALQKISKTVAGFSAAKAFVETIEYFSQFLK